MIAQFCFFFQNNFSSFYLLAKLILSHPLWGGGFLILEIEFASMKKNEYYKNEEAILPSTGNVAKEKTETAFLDYTLLGEIWMFLREFDMSM